MGTNRKQRAIAAEIKKAVEDGEASIARLRRQAADLREDANYDDPEMMAQADRLDASAAKTQASVDAAKALIAKEGV